METIDIKTRGGLTLTMPASDERSALLSRSEIYNKTSIKALVRLKAASGFAVDVGANCGQSALTYVNYFKRVLSFEPVPDLYECLVKNIEQNGVAGIETINAAVGASIEGSLDFRFTPSNHFGSGVPSKVTDNCIKVPCTTLDTTIPKDNPTFIKIDVEGYELFVLTGALGVIRRAKPIILVELVPEFMRKHKQHPQDVFDLMAEEGYLAYDTKLNQVSIEKWCPLKRERDRFLIHKSHQWPKRGFGL